jgi:hypothetical protein
MSEAAEPGAEFLKIFLADLDFRIVFDPIRNPLADAAIC